MGGWLKVMRTDYKGVLGELLEETFLGWPVDVEVQCLSGQQQSRKGKDGEQH